MKHHSKLTDSQLGKEVTYPKNYDPTLLFPIERKQQRKILGITSILPFFGVDVWNHYEVSWLNPKGKPISGIARIYYDCNTPYLIESKSLKLYFNSFNNDKFANAESLKKIAVKDLSAVLHGEVFLDIFPVENIDTYLINGFSGICIDGLDIECHEYEINASYLFTEDLDISEVVYSNNLKSNCLVTNQPDWGSVEISYVGKKINHEGLLKYLVSYRNHNGFHEQCIEQIFVDIMRQCSPDRLTVDGRYTRRGGIDINPLRTSESTFDIQKSKRLFRQ